MLEHSHGVLAASATESEHGVLKEIKLQLSSCKLTRHTVFNTITHRACSSHVPHAVTPHVVRKFAPSRNTTKGSGFGWAGTHTQRDKLSVGVGRGKGQEELHNANPLLLPPPAWLYVRGHMDKPRIFGRALPQLTSSSGFVQLLRGLWPLSFPNFFSAAG